MPPKSPKLFISLHNIIKAFVVAPWSYHHPLQALRSTRTNPASPSPNRLSRPIPPRRSVYCLRCWRRVPECHLEGEELRFPVYRTADGECATGSLEVYSNFVSSQG